MLFAFHFSVACLANYAVLRRVSGAVRLAWLVYVTSYTITTVLGATIIGLRPAILDTIALSFGLDTRAIQSIDTFRYWLLLYAPLEIPAFVILACHRLRFGAKKIIATTRSHVDIDAVSYLTVVAALSAYCFGLLYRHNYLGNIFLSIQNARDYQSLIVLRTGAMEDLHTIFYGIVYMAFPTMSLVALWQAFAKRSSVWRVLFSITLCATVILSLSIVLKGPLVLYIMTLCLGSVVLRLVRPVTLVAVGIACVFAVTALQVLLTGSWSLAATAFLLIFRMAHGVPYYVALFPGKVGFLGTNHGLGLLGIGGANNDNLLVFDHMYPNINWVQGATAAPSHLRAYSQGGYPAALAVLFITACLIVLLGRWRERSGGPVAFAAYVQGLVAIYYLTQTSLRGILVESYSVVFIALPLAAVLALTQIVRLAAAGVQREVESCKDRTPMRPKLNS